MSYMNHIHYFLECFDPDFVEETAFNVREAIWTADDIDAQDYFDPPRIKDTGIEISVDTGSEGPKHDPYGYTEVTVYFEDRTVTVHSGLVVWHEIRYSDGPFHRIHCPYEEAERLFEKETGVSIEKAHRLWEQRQTYCGDCETSDYSERAGYPGETFIVCNHCGGVISSQLNLGAVI